MAVKNVRRTYGDLPAASLPLADTDIFSVFQNGRLKKVDKSDIAGAAIDWKAGTETGFHSAGIDDNATVEVLNIANSTMDYISTTTPIFTVKTSAASSQDSEFRLGGARTASSANDIAKYSFQNIGVTTAEIAMRDPAASSAAGDGSLIFRTSDNFVLANVLTLGADKSATFTGAITGVSFGGITSANLLDKSATETISGTYTFSNKVNAASVEATGLGTNGNPGTDDAYFGGYGVLGSRASFYVSNAAGAVLLNHTGTHGTNTKLATSATGITVTGDVAATTIGGITQANLLDKSATETVSGAWDYSGSSIGSARGLNGRYSNVSGNASFAAQIWTIDSSSWDSAASGNSWTPNNLYGIAWVRASNASARPDIGEGLYTFVAGTFDSGMGGNGIETVGTVKGTRLISTIATGTAPLTVASTTLVTNLNAQRLNGHTESDAAGNSTIVCRTSSGYIRANYFNTSAGATTGTPTNYFVETGSDGYIRKLSKANMRSNLGISFDKHITIEEPASGDDVTWFFTNRAITATEIRLVGVGTSVSSVITIRHSTDRNATGTVVDTNTVTSTTTGHDVTVISDATIPANSFVWIEVGTTTGTVTSVHVSMIGTLD